MTRSLEPTNSAPSDPTTVLLARLRGGDRAALEELFVRSYGRLGRVVRLRLGALHGVRFELHDVLQEAFLEAFQSLDRFESKEGAGFLDWVARIAVNKLKDGRRRDRAKKRDLRKEARLDSPADSSLLGIDRAFVHVGPTPSEAVHAADMAARLDACLAELDETEREVLILRYYLDASWKEIGQSLGRTSEAAEQLGRRAKLHLARRLAEKGVEPPDHD